jgi:hypothetical protein
VGKIQEDTGGGGSCSCCESWCGTADTATNLFFLIPSMLIGWMKFATSPSDLYFPLDAAINFASIVSGSSMIVAGALCTLNMISSSSLSHCPRSFCSELPSPPKLSCRSASELRISVHSFSARIPDTSSELRPTRDRTRVLFQNHKLEMDFENLDSFLSCILAM